MKSAFGTIAFVIAGLDSWALAQNVGARITDGSAIFDYTTDGTGALPSILSATGPAGNLRLNFQIDGTPGNAEYKQIFFGNWFYRVAGDTRERFFVNATSRTLTGTNQVDYTFGPISTSAVQLPGTSSTMMFRVNKTGLHSALLTTSAGITNNTASPLLINLFFSLDITLGANSPTWGGDAYAPLDTSGGNRQWTISDTTAHTSPWTGKFLGIGAHGAAAASSTSINSQMTDSSATNFIPDVGAAGVAAADNAAVMQWNVTIAPGETFNALAYYAVGRNGVDPVIPSPGAPAVLGLGAIVATRRRR